MVTKGQLAILPTCDDRTWSTTRENPARVFTADLRRVFKTGSAVEAVNALTDFMGSDCLAFPYDPDRDTPATPSRRARARGVRINKGSGRATCVRLNPWRR